MPREPARVLTKSRVAVPAGKGWTWPEEGPSGSFPSSRQPEPPALLPCVPPRPEAPATTVADTPSDEPATLVRCRTGGLVGSFRLCAGETPKTTAAATATTPAEAVTGSNQAEKPDVRGSVFMLV